MPHYHTVACVLKQLVCGRYPADQSAEDDLVDAKEGVDGDVGADDGLQRSHPIPRSSLSKRARISIGDAE